MLRDETVTVPKEKYWSNAQVRNQIGDWVKHLLNPENPIDDIKYELNSKILFMVYPLDKLIVFLVFILLIKISFTLRALNYFFQGFSLKIFDFGLCFKIELMDDGGE